MKFIAFTTLFINLSFYCLSQEPPNDVRVDSSTGAVRFYDVVQVEGASKSTLYERARVWFAKYYKSSKDVLELELPEAGKLQGNGLTDIYIETDIGNVPIKMYYTIMLEVKDNRYRYEIRNIEYQGYPSAQFGIPPRVPCEDHLVKWRYKKNGKERPKSRKYLVQTLNSFNELVIVLKENMTDKNTSGDW